MIKLSNITKVFHQGTRTIQALNNVSLHVPAGEKPLEISTFGQLKQSITLPPHLDTGSSNFALHTFRGAAYSTPDEKYEKYKFDTIADNENLNISSKGGWVAMLQQYFATAWIPHNDGTNNFYTANLGNGIAAIGYKSQPVLVQPGQTGAMNATGWRICTSMIMSIITTIRSPETS